MRSILSFFLAVCLVVSLAACGSKEGGEDQPSPGKAAADFGELRAKFTGMPVEADYVGKLLSHEGSLYMLYAVMSEDGTYEYYVCSMNEDGSGAETIQGPSSIADIGLDSAGGLWTLWTEDWSSYAINSYSSDGALLSSIALDAIVDPSLNIGALNIDGKDRIYIAAYSDSKTLIYVFDRDGNAVFELEGDGIPVATVTTAEGLVGVCLYNTSSAASSDSLVYNLTLIDPDAKAWGDTVRLGIPQNLYAGQSYSFYLNDTTNVYGYDAQTGESETIFNWNDIGLPADSASVAEISDGRFAVIAGTVNYTTLTYSYDFAIVEESDGTQDDRQVITLASLIPNSNVSVAAAEFNKTSEDYRIEIKTYLSYSDLANGESINNAITKFSTDIITGNGPDIIDMMNLPVDLYATKGLLEDLYAYIDADPEISREDYFENILDAMSIDGALPCVTDGIYIITIFGSSDVFGSEPGITTAELYDILSERPEYEKPFGELITKSTFLTYALYGNIGLIDWEIGQCNFNTPEFIKLLELSSLLPSEAGEPDYSVAASDMLDASRMVTDGEQLAAIEAILSMEQLAAYSRRLGDKLNIVGFPVPDGVCHVMDAMVKLGISSQSQHKEAAWEFVRTILDNKYQTNSMMIPIGYSAFDEMTKNVLDGNSIFSSYYEDLELTQTDADALKALMESITYSTSYNEVINEIVLTEAEAYWAGSITAQEAANRIQGRVQLYVNEQF